MQRKYWYAVMKDHDDTDWGYGSMDLDEAKKMAIKFHDGYIAVIDGDFTNEGVPNADPICVYTIEQDEF